MFEKILNYKKNLNNKLEEKLSTKECPLLKAMHKKELDFIMKLDLDSCEIIKVKQSEIYNQEDDSEIEK